MRICMVLEGCYPYVRGGVSAWMHSLITSNPQHDYCLWLIAANSEDSGNYKYELPENVKEVREVFLDKALKLQEVKKDKFKFSEQERQALRQLILCKDPDWDLLFKLYNTKKVSAQAFLRSEAFLNILLEICLRDYPHVSFAEFFHSIRSMFLPTLYLLGQSVPQADVYHATSTGYGGLLAALGAWRTERPFILTEHGIYTREREEEILRAKWISPYFKQHWINLFYTLAHCSYDRADCVTALFHRYSQIQTEIGCDPQKQKVISNGIEVEKYLKIPDCIPDGVISITAIVRFHPIKDIKTMIHSFFALKQRLSNVKLYILGDTDDEEYRQECVDLVEQLGIKDIELPGNVDTAEYLAITDFTVITSISEGQPLAVLESLAAGRPCVATDVGCCRELLEGGEGDDFGRAGIVVPPMHSQAVANAMELLALREDLRRDMGQAGRKRVSTYYRHSNMVKNYNKNYEEVIKRWQA